MTIFDTDRRKMIYVGKIQTCSGKRVKLRSIIIRIYREGARGMIHKLSGIHETVDFREDEQVCLYYNDEYENYPPHWHTSFEVLMPIVNGYKALCGGKE